MEVKQVVVDGLVVSKMISHARAWMPEYVTGRLLGFDRVQEGTIEVTDAVPLPQGLSEADKNAFVDRMLQTMARIKNSLDPLIVGTYQTVHFASAYEPVVVDAVYRAQLDAPNYVLLTYDPYQSTKGRLVLKALRLSARFMKLYSHDTILHDLLRESNIDSSDIYDELPVFIHNSHLAHGFLYEVAEQKTADCTSDRLSLSHSNYLQTNIDMLSSRMDSFYGDQMMLLHYLRDKRKRLTDGEYRREKIDPDRLNPLLAKAQMNLLVQQLTTASTGALSKLYVTQSLHKPVSGEGAANAANIANKE